MTNTTDHLATITIPGDPQHPGHTIPAPTDPTERATWQQAVQNRIDRGLGLLVGQDLIARDGTVLPDEQWGTASNPARCTTDENRDMTSAARDSAEQAGQLVRNTRARIESASKDGQR